MKNFLNQTIKVSDEAEKFIKDTLKKKKKIVLLDSATADEGDFFEFFDLPIAVKFDKYNMYSEYAILSIEKKGRNVILHTLGRGDAEGELDFYLRELETENMCHLADVIETRLAEQ